MLAIPADTPLPAAWANKPWPDERPPIPGDVTRMVAGHRVHHWDGRDWLSVSTVLGIMGWGNVSHVPPQALEWGRVRGTLVDQMCRWLEMGVLDWDSVDPRLKPYVEAWQRFLDYYKIPLGMMEHEALIVNPSMGVFGYADRRVTWDVYAGGATHKDDPHRTVRHIIDIKTSAHIGRAYRYQLAAYCADGERPLVVQLQKTGKYVPHDFSETVAADRARFAILAEEAHLYLAEEGSRKK